MDYNPLKAYDWRQRSAGNRGSADRRLRILSGYGRGPAEHPLAIGDPSAAG
ncbi:hypothetical protein L484_006685 [Morus notabilis]|uniref:Uncharacterized protein n=1 Tax=Morus notabilis TaxID=981085 RepID=W9SZC7_9ROSA|nr:hypothetical protein L484_006685 [Morus notabilis]